MTTCTDVVIQTVSPHQRPRLVDLFERRHAGARPPADDADAALASHLAAWPPHGFGQHATEVGPATRKGGVLVLVRGVTAPPAEVVRFVRDAPMARAVARVYCLGPSPADDQVVQHVDDLLAALEAAGPPAGTVRVMAFPKSLELELQERLPLTWNLAPKDPDIYLVAVDLGGAAAGLYGGPSGPAAAAGAPPPPPGAGGVRFALVPPSAVLADTEAARSRGDAPSKAVFKLAEALATAAPGALDAARTIVDVGAAPGGWTRLLATRAPGATVLAVDKADLDPDVASLPNVVHVRCTGEHASAAVAAAAPGGVDLLVCDVNLPARLLPGTLGPLLALLRPGARAVVTLKTFTPSRCKVELVRGLAAALPTLRLTHAAWLTANTIHERTLVFVKRGEGDGGEGGA